MAKNPATKVQAKGPKAAGKAAVPTGAKAGAAKRDLKAISDSKSAKALEVKGQRGVSAKATSKASSRPNSKAAIAPAKAAAAKKAAPVKIDAKPTGKMVKAAAPVTEKKATQKVSLGTAKGEAKKAKAETVAPVANEPTKVAPDFADPVLKSTASKNAGKSKGKANTLVATSAQSVMATSVVTKEPAVVKEPKEKAETSGKGSKAMKIEGTPEEWRKLQAKFVKDDAQTYDIKGHFEATRPLQHKVFGWGWVISNENDRLEVLFQDGKRVLISNRK